MKQKIDQVQWLSPGDLTPYERNAKLHPQAQIDYIANSILQFGWTQPIVVDENNVVVIGHGRLLAAKQLMLDKVPVVRRDDLTEEQTKALRIIDNRIAKTKTDMDILAEELARRDMASEQISQEDAEELSARMEEYLSEFDKNGLAAVSVDL